jgi:hypothetical protein
LPTTSGSSRRSAPPLPPLLPARPLPCWLGSLHGVLLPLPQPLLVRPMM